MKKAIVFVCVLCSCITGFAQQTNPTNNKELQDKINQAQQQLNNLTPEQKETDAANGHVHQYALQSTNVF
jgi:peptidoglycan hydrolase CwlO-like protein